MGSRVKTFCLTGIIIIGLSAANGVAAQAAPFFRVVESPTTIRGEQIGGEQFFNTSAGKTECSGSAWSGTTIKQSTALTLSTSYSNCALNGEAASVEMNGCQYNLSLVANSSPATSTVNIGLLERNHNQNGQMRHSHRGRTVRPQTRDVRDQ